MSAILDAKWPEITLSAPIAKKFQISLHFRYEQRLYAPDIVATFVDKEPTFCGSAEAVLLSELSAMRKGQFDWWLRTWDDKAAAIYAEKYKVGSQEQQKLLREWATTLASVPPPRLVRWILTGQYVIVTYTLPTRDTPAETAIAFHLSNGRWKATLDLEQDPVFLHYRDGVERTSRLVR
jgi:hypothetical protein